MEKPKTTVYVSDTASSKARLISALQTAAVISGISLATIGITGVIVINILQRIYEPQTQSPVQVTETQVTKATLRLNPVTISDTQGIIIGDKSAIAYTLQKAQQKDRDAYMRSIQTGVASKMIFIVADGTPVEIVRQEGELVLVRLGSTQVLSMHQEDLTGREFWTPEVFVKR